MAYEPIAAPVHSAAKRLWFNDGLKWTRSAQAMEPRRLTQCWSDLKITEPRRSVALPDERCDGN